MTEIIKENIKNPDKLEKLYRDDRKSFETDFEKIYPEIEDTEMAKFWKSRLDFDKSKLNMKVFSSDLYLMIGVCLIAGFLIKIPDLFHIDLKAFFYYEKDAGIIVFLGLTLYAILNKRDFSKKGLITTILIFLISIVYINLLPNIKSSASVNLVYIHMPLLMWCAYGLVFIDFDLRDKSKRIEFIRHNGDMAIIGAIVLIAGGALAMITLGLFEAIGMKIHKFYFDYIIIVGLVSAPVLSAFILKNFTTLTNKIAPIIANIFSPLVLLTLISYLLAMAITGKDPYNNRDLLLVFNLMLIGVISIIIFSVSETSMYGKQKFNEMILFFLSVISIMTNLIALSAIIYRLGEFGITPNRVAILGSNILIFVNLILITIDLFKINFRKSGMERVELTIAGYLPVYIVWVLIVVFAFPAVFGMK